MLRTDSGTAFRARYNANVGMGIPECPGHSVALCVVHCALLFGVFLTQRLNVVLQKLPIRMPLFVLHYHVDLDPPSRIPGLAPHRTRAAAATAANEQNRRVEVAFHLRHSPPPDGASESGNPKDAGIFFLGCPTYSPVFSLLMRTDRGRAFPSDVMSLLVSAYA